MSFDGNSEENRQIGMLKNLPMQIEELVEKKKMKSNKIPKVET